MIVKELEIQGAFLINFPVYEDIRGTFNEWFKSDELVETFGFNFQVKQANISVSNKGVLRGIHYSLATSGQAKLLTCLTGGIRDVIVDIRPNSPTFKKFVAIDLVAGDGNVVFIGPNLGHGFLAVEDNATVCYLLNSPFSPSHEFEIDALDSELNINWKSEGGIDFLPTRSNKDKFAPPIEERLRQGLLPKL